MKPTGNHSMKVLYAGIAVLLLITGFVVYRAVAPAKDATPAREEDVVSTLPQADASIGVSLAMNKAKPNTVVLKVTNLASKYASVGYELTYDSQGLIKGVNSGSKPIEVSGQDGFDREVYLGTCSRNVCKPDLGVTKASVVLEFTAADGKKSQFSKEFAL